MSSPNLPHMVINMLASVKMREHHANWHAARNLNLLEQDAKDYLIAEHYTASRQFGQNGSGLDFLYMHRTMIKMVNDMLAGNTNYPKVQGWSLIPFNHNDTDYPMPPEWPDSGIIKDFKNQETTDKWQHEVEQKFENNAWLKTVSIDNAGIEIENGIHTWFHLHWAAQPWYHIGYDRNDVRNDDLADPYSSHVNKSFWKFHGWIDDRITQWEMANNTTADFLNAWVGPHHHEGMNSHANKMPDSLIKFSRNFFVSSFKSSSEKI